MVIGQSSEATKAKLEAREDWEETNRDHDLVSLLKSINSLMHNQMQNDRYTSLAAYESIRSIINIRQHRHEETADYRKRFTAAVEVLEHIDVAFGAMFQGVAEYILTKTFNTTREEASDDLATEAEGKAVKSVLAVMFLQQAFQARYGEVSRELQKDFIKKEGQLPFGRHRGIQHARELVIVVQTKRASSLSGLRGLFHGRRNAREHFRTKFNGTNDCRKEEKWRKRSVTRIVQQLRRDGKRLEKLSETIWIFETERDWDS